MSTGFRVIRNAQKKMRFLGNGCYSAVFALDDERVLKIGTNLEDPWLNYVENITEDNPHFPRVYSIRRFSGYYIAKMERLVQFPYLMGGRIEDISRWILYDEKLEDSTIHLEEAKAYIQSFKNKFRIDAHIGNIMVRPNTLQPYDVNNIVITDPLSEETISDDKDLEQWFDKVILEVC